MSTPVNDALADHIALSLIPQIGPGIYKNIISYCGSPTYFFTMPKGKAEKIPGIGSKLLSLRSQYSQYLSQAEKIIQDCIKHDVQIHSYADPSYPARLKAFIDAPVILFTKGNINLNPERSIGIVGTRNASEYGRSITKKIVEDLAPYAPTIISGLAYGIDIEAHRAALQSSLPTLGILGTSLDKIYPAAHKSVANSMMEQGGLLSEYRLGSDLNRANFPQRNRIIAGLSDAVIIVEAAIKGGALITAEIAYSYNKEVFAVPGNLQSKYSEGCNNLIRSMKAGIYLGPKEIEEALSWHLPGTSAPAKPAPLDLSAFEAEEQAIVKVLLDNKELEIDQLSWMTQLSLSQLATKLLQLEFQGIIKSLPGKKYKVVER
ncbi:MAG TPA: DNA-processing protein DprA [Cyclobacteriaceae bacterium]|nr:DNA-processing protein DprA [Cyclobacteriaceae bacterium]